MLIELSGIDGAGKSTQMERLQRHANERGIECHIRTLKSTSRRILARIGATRGAREWRDLFDPALVELATALDLYQQVHALIVPIRQPGEMILTDSYARYWLASAHTNLPRPDWAVDEAYRLFPAPDLALHLRVDPTVALERIVARAKGDHVLREGGIGVVEALERAYVHVDRTLGYRPVVLDAARGPDEVARDAVEAVRSTRSTLDPLDREMVARLGATS